jgi:predicted nucleic acid-binding protein
LIVCSSRRSIKTDQSDGPAQARLHDRRRLRLHGFPDDLPYLNLALAANVAFIVSRDKDLLDLMKDEAFAAKHPQLRIVDPAAFLVAVRPTTT